MNDSKISPYQTAEKEPCVHCRADEHWDCTENYCTCDCRAAEAPTTVSCDDGCGALTEPQTLDEYKAALEHWMSHSQLYGCSHGR